MRGTCRLSEVFTPPVGRLSEVFTPPVGKLSVVFTPPVGKLSEVLCYKLVSAYLAFKKNNDLTLREGGGSV